MIIMNSNSFSINEPTDVKLLDIRQAVCHDNDILQSAYDHLHMEWLGTEQFITGLYHCFSNDVQYEGSPAITHVMQTGLTAYAAIQRRSYRYYFPHEKLKNFLSGCLSSAAQSCRFVVKDQSTNERWTAKCEQPLTRWRENRSDVTIYNLELEDEKFKKLLYRKLIPQNMKLALLRHGHEDAIISGHLDGCH